MTNTATAETLIPVPINDYPEFADNPNNTERYKVRFDGSHFTGTRVGRHIKRHSNTPKERTTPKEYDECFNELFWLTVALKLRKKQKIEYITEAMYDYFGDADDILDYVEKNVKRQLHNIHKKKQRFMDKYHLQIWTHFCTWTYDSKKVTEEEFQKKLRKCLSNIATRYGWRYMGVWERGGKTDRLHFHAIVYVPNSNMVGKIIQVKDYDTESGTMQTTYQNTFFNERFGRTDFEPIDAYALYNGTAAQYILKYITKGNGKIIYSRGLPGFLILDIPDEDVAMVIDKYNTPVYLFYSDCKWEMDIFTYRDINQGKQISFNDIPIESTL